jgi:peptidyl-prolyl cis-trans isomerase C
MNRTNPEYRSANRPGLHRRLLGVIATAAVVAGVAQAQSPVLLRGPAAAVTADDLRAGAQRIPAASRDGIMSRPDNVQRQAQDLYVRRALAIEAERAGIDKDPVVAALIRQARERILSDAQLAEIDLAANPSAEAVARRAREIYNADPSRFQSPAQTRARHILVAHSADGKARSQAEELLTQLKGGASFEQLARQHSADVPSGAKGGDLGWFSVGTMLKEFDDAVAALKNPGDLSGIVETQFGFHIVRLDGRRPAGVRPFEDMREELEREVRAKAQQDARQTKIRELLGAAQAKPEAIENFSNQFRKP